MSFISNFISSSFGELLKQGKNIIDEFVTTEEEKSRAKLRFERMVKQFAQNKQAELTKRHKYDMKSDSWLSKNVRPLMLISCFITISTFALLDGTVGGVEIPEGYITLLGQAFILMLGFYFGSRGLEKWKAYDIEKEVRKEREKNTLRKYDTLPRASLPDRNE